MGRERWKKRRKKGRKEQRKDGWEEGKISLSQFMINTEDHTFTPIFVGWRSVFSCTSALLSICSEWKKIDTYIFQGFAGLTFSIATALSHMERYPHSSGNFWNECSNLRGAVTILKSVQDIHQHAMFWHLMGILFTYIFHWREKEKWSPHLIADCKTTTTTKNRPFLHAAMEHFFIEAWPRVVVGDQKVQNILPVSSGINWYKHFFYIAVIT